MIETVKPSSNTYLSNYRIFLVNSFNLQAYCLFFLDLDNLRATIKSAKELDQKHKEVMKE